MPKAIALKQRNKPHKGLSKKIHKPAKQPRRTRVRVRPSPAAKKASLLKMKKPETKTKQLAQQVQKTTRLPSTIKSQIAGLVRKQLGQKTIVFVPFNSQADTGRLIKSLRDLLGADEPAVPLLQQDRLSFNYFKFNYDPAKNPGLPKENFLFMAPSASLMDIVDACKVADIICPVLSCSDADPTLFSLDPFKSAKAFDERGYQLLTILRRQGLPLPFCLVQDLERFQAKHQHTILKLFSRYVQSEFGKDAPVVAFTRREQALKMLRLLGGIKPARLEWRSHRGYVLVEEAQYQRKGDGLLSLSLTGVLKGSTLGANQLVHLTGIGDFQVERLEVVQSESKISSRGKKVNSLKEELPVQFAFNPESLDPLSGRATPLQLRDNQIEQALQELRLGNDEMAEEVEIEGQDDQDGDYWQEEEGLAPKKEDYMQRRTEEQLQFEDEVEYGADVQVSERYRKYRGMKSFRLSDLNNRENLPDYFARLFVFKNFNRLREEALAKVREEAFAYPNLRVRVTLADVPESVLKRIRPESPLILSGLLPNQHKMTMLHCKVQWLGVDEPPASKTVFCTQIGFRRMTANVIFSHLQSTGDRAKYTKRVKDSNWVMASFYGLCCYGPAQALLFREETLVMAGQYFKADLLLPIIKRITLTGYPFKINRRRATIRFMFFNPRDVRYFKPVELVTRLGLRGNIEQPIGTHGLMKCLFNNHLKQHDTVCMHLYKRVFPKPDGLL